MTNIERYGIEIGQRYQQADGSPRTVEVVRLIPETDDVVVRSDSGVESVIDAWKLAVARYRRIGWIACSERLPDAVEDFYGFTHSAEVLVVCDDGSQFIAYLVRYEDNEWPPQWKQKGCDGYDLASVTHWMILPESPR